jgi:cytochrome c oxidase subunit 2
VGIIGVNFLKGGFYRFEKAVSYYELLWTAFPTVILLRVAGPRICLLYFHEQREDPSLNIKCVGHQWYWRYDYSDFDEVSFDSFIVPAEELSGGEIRFLEADIRIVIPTNIKIQLFVTREDVIHSWALPVQGMKIDATPGRLNTIRLVFPLAGVFLGQCRELCGANHRLIPIAVEATTPFLFIEWFKRIYNDKILINFL